MTHKLRGRRKLWAAVLVAASCLAIVLSAISFIHHYRALKVSLRDERAVYVNEITGQLTRSITAKREWLMSRVGSSASAFDQSEVGSFAEASRLFTYKENENYAVLLVADTGSTYTLEGKTAQIRNFDILSATLAEQGAQYHHDKSSDGEDYWVFSSTVAPRVVDGIRVVALYEIYDVAQFHDDLHLGLFGDDGYTYIVDPYGGIQLGPEIEADFIGYNLISSLRNTGIDGAAADRIEADIRQRSSDSLFVGFHGTDWVVQYEPLTDSDEMAVVIAPIAATSHETTVALRDTLISVIGVMAGMTILVLILFIFSNAAAKERDRQLYELELKNRVASTKNDFLAKMSHDIRTPLNAIIGMNYIATTQVDESAPVMDYLKQIDTSAKYLLDILNDILDMSKIESGKMELRNEPFRLQEVIDTITAISYKQAVERGVDFTIHSDEALSEAYIGDRQRLAQILMNLTNNAVKFTPAGGEIDLRIALEERVGDRDKLRLTVADTGIGMTDAFMQNLFTPFTQDQHAAASSMGGSGLGLSIVKSFVDMMGGTIRVQSHLGVGSTFDVFIELERTEAPAKAKQAPAAPVDDSVLHGKRALLVEDNEINLVIATKIITRFGLLVETARDGLEALERFGGVANGYYDIIITDIQMPRMDGYQFANAVREMSRADAQTIPIVAMSANAFDDDIRKSLLHGMNAHLKKPVDVEELRSALLKYLGGGD